MFRSVLTFLGFIPPCAELFEKVDLQFHKHKPDQQSDEKNLNRSEERRVGKECRL